MLIRPSVGSITYATADGRAVYVMRVGDDYIAGRAEGSGPAQTAEYKLDGTGVIIEPELRRYQYRVTERPWFQAAVTNNSPVWTDVYYWFSQQPEDFYDVKIPGIGYVRQLRDTKGNLIGVLSVDVTLHSLSHILSDADIARFGTVMIVDTQDRVLATSDHPASAHSGHLPMLSEARSADTKAAWAVLRDADRSKPQFFHLAELGKHVYVEPLTPSPDRNWCLVTVLPDANVTGEARKMQQNAVQIGTSIILATVLIGLVLAALLSRPVAKLAAHLKTIGRGNFDQEVHLSTTVEFQQLSDAVNDMCRQLREQVRLQAEKEAVELASAARSAFFSRVTHELRTPLNAIIGYTEMLDESDSIRNDPVARQDLQRVMRASRQLLTLINDLLDLAKVESSAMRMRLSEFDPADVVREVEEIARPLALKQQNRLITVTTDAPSQMRSDPQRLKQILLNLVANSAKFTTAGTITLSVAGDRTHVCFTVADDGVGMPADKVQQMFEPFEQMQMTTDGTGLGLAICRQLTQMLNGEIDVSTAPGEGMTVRIYFPLHSPVADDTPQIEQIREAIR
jgi:signal transduction histidine kinase